MPTVAVDKEDLWERLGQKFSKSALPTLWVRSDSDIANEQFDHLCFEFGIELDEDVRLHMLQGDKL